MTVAISFKERVPVFYLRLFEARVDFAAVGRQFIACSKLIKVTGEKVSDSSE